MNAHVQTAARGTRRLVDEMAHTPGEVLVLVGLWLTSAPLVLDHAKAGLTYPGLNDVAVGLSIVVLALVRVLSPRHTSVLAVISGLLGVWLLAAPFVRGYAGMSPAATANDIAVGLVVILLAVFSWRGHDKHA
ncbi:SPW repeat domain-containing protein [Actinoplanes sp. G11-F43]|uniref:SPW repeat domain-containing protein n=1 Tax=Actinoplanes sp. G11-F43 TaxID=3424130 RepID=UPI003D329F44